MDKDTLLVGIMKDVERPPSKIMVQTPIGSIDTGDDNPVLDVLIVILIFFASCLYIYAKYFRK